MKKRWFFVSLRAHDPDISDATVTSSKRRRRPWLVVARILENRAAAAAVLASSIGLDAVVASYIEPATATIPALSTNVRPLHFRPKIQHIFRPSVSPRYHIFFRSPKKKKIPTSSCIFADFFSTRLVQSAGASLPARKAARAAAAHAPVLPLTPSFYRLPSVHLN